MGSPPDLADRGVTAGVDRISSREVFRRFRLEGRRVRRGPLTVVSVPRPGRPAVAFAVPRRVGSAVVRNRLRRQLRAAVRDLAADGIVPPGDHLVIIAGSARGESMIALKDHLAAAWARS